MIARFIRRVKYGIDQFMTFIDGHPRTGWYIVLLGLTNVVLNLIDLFK